MGYFRTCAARALAVGLGGNVPLVTDCDPPIVRAVVKRPTNGPCRFPVRAIALCALAGVAVSALGCAARTGQPVITAEPGNTYIRERFTSHLKDLEQASRKKFRGNAIHIAAPVRASYEDWRKMPVGRIRGRQQGGLTSWKLLSGQATVYFAQWKGKVPDWLIRHEALHAILLSNGVLGHPEEYAYLFAKTYWWLPEDYFIGQSREIIEAADEASCGPHCVGHPVRP